jgi:hypothetical protein
VLSPLTWLFQYDDYQQVWGELCPGVDQGDAVADWLEKALNRPGVRLVSDWV